MGRKAPRKRLAYRVISAFTRVFDAHDTPHGCSAEHPNVSRRSAHPSFRVSEAKVQTPGAENAPREQWSACCLRSWDRGWKSPNLQKNRKIQGSGPPARAAAKARSRASFARYVPLGSSPRKRGPITTVFGYGSRLSARFAGVGRDDDGLVRAKQQPAAVRNDRRRGFPVSGLLFTGNAATHTCRAFQRPSRIQVAARLPTSSSSPIKPANTGSTPMPRTTLASRVRSPSQSSPW
jgi:hypothetical protein